MTSPDLVETLSLPPGLSDLAEENGLQVVHVICDWEKVDAGNSGGVSFFALVEFVPRIGETIVSQDGLRCRVRDVLHKVTSVHRQDVGDVFLLLTTVIAVVEGEQGKSS